MRVGILQGMNNDSIALVVEGLSEYTQRDKRIHDVSLKKTNAQHYMCGSPV